MSLFKKPTKKTIQRRVFTENDDEDDDAPMEAPEAPQIRGDLKKNKSKNKPKQALLSFETEEEGEVFQVKKSSHSKKIMKLFEKERQQKKKEVKQEKDEPKPKEKTEIVTDDLVLVVNENHKTAKPPSPAVILSGRDALCAGKDDLSSDEDDTPANHRFSRPDNFKKVLESGAIPDAAMIHAARKKRQRAREMGDFIPVADEEEQQQQQQQQQTSEDNKGGRLIREGDNDGSDEDERIDMDVNLTLRDQERRREQFMAAAQDSDQQEIDEWEDQQLRKGVTGAAAGLASDLVFSEYQQSNYVTSLPQTNQHQQIHPQIITQAIEPGIPRTPQMIAEKLREHYQNVCASREQNLKKLEQAQVELELATKGLEELKAKAPVAADRYKFYQILRGYVTDLVECLDEKVGHITSLELRAMDLLAKRSEWLIERRRQDVRDQAEEATSKGAIKKGPDDEDKIRRAAEREGRRTRRRRARELGGHPKHVEGMSSDDEISQQDTLSFDKEREQIESEIREVFEDVVDDYSSVASILIKFEEWREADLTSYSEAYATLCLPKIVSPLVRLDLIFWDPLNDSQDIEKLDWYRTLALYGLHDDETEATLAQDPDLNLLPTIIEKVIVPKLTQLVDRCWDPLSNSQTLRLVGLISRYIRKFPTLGPASKALINLFNAILHKMKMALEHDVFIPLTPKLIESKSPFFQRQFASGLKLLKNITSWQGILNEKTLRNLALNSLLNRYLLSASKFCLVTDAVSKVSLISFILPRVWLQGNTPELKMFKESVVNLSQQLDKNNPLHLESIETVNNILKTLRT